MHISYFKSNTNYYSIPQKDSLEAVSFTYTGVARHIFNHIERTKRTWRILQHSIGVRFFSDDKQEDISSPLEHLKIHYCWGSEDDDHMAYDRFIKRSNVLSLMAKIIDRKEEANVCFLKNAVVGTEWGLREMNHFTKRRCFQSMISILNAFQRDLNSTYFSKRNGQSSSNNNFRQSLRKILNATTTSGIRSIQDSADRIAILSR